MPDTTLELDIKRHGSSVILASKLSSCEDCWKCEMTIFLPLNALIPLGITAVEHLTGFILVFLFSVFYGIKMSARPQWMALRVLPIARKKF